MHVSFLQHVRVGYEQAHFNRSRLNWWYFDSWDCSRSFWIL